MAHFEFVELRHWCVCSLRDAAMFR